MSRFVQEQSAQRNETWASVPVQLEPPFRPTSMGVPPPVQWAAPASVFNAAGTHVPPAQPVPLAHLFAQLPQFSLSLFGSMQAPAQGIRPDRQPEEQALAEHTWAPVHLIPHPPQLLGSALVAMQTPLQRVWYAGHAQTPFEQIWPGAHDLHELPLSTLALPLSSWAPLS
jgi:hypothetical protein